MAASTVQLRPYQRRTHEAIFTAWDAGLRRVMISAATGAGKSVIFGAVARDHHAHHRGAGPVVLLAHRVELVEQAAQHFSRANPDLRVEAVVGAPGRVGSAKYLQAQYRWRSMDVLVTTPQTLNSDNTSRIFPDPSLVIVDEAHHYASVMFKRIMTKLGCFSGTRALGVTATPFREDHRKLEDIFQKMVASIDISWLITHRTDPVTGEESECAPGEGYLVPPRLKHLLVDGLDLSDVPTSKMSGAVDFREKELAEAMEAAGAFEIVGKTLISEFSERKGAIFCPTVASSKHLTEIMNQLAGATVCGHIDGTTDKLTRARVINDYRTDKIRWLCNVGIISEGFDIPEIDMVVLARPTKSRIFFRQAVGRALRPAPGKDHAIVLDVAGASDGHSLAGVAALTDADVLDPETDESLTELLDRSNRARRGVVDRIVAHSTALRDRQQAGEDSFERIKLTAEGLVDKLPALATFIARAQPPVDRLLETCTEGIDLALTASTPPAKTLDDLNAIEQTIAGMSAAAQKPLGELEALKTTLRTALLALKEQPEGELARAMVTGHAATVNGNLFGEEEERYQPMAPGKVQSLKVRGARKAPPPVFASRQGWAIRSGKDHLYCPVHGGKDVKALVVAVKLSDELWCPVVWDRASQNVAHLSAKGVADEGQPIKVDQDTAYKLIAGFASEYTDSPSLLDPRVQWRKRAASEGAVYMARRTNPTHGLPEEATAGYVADVITAGQNETLVNRLATYVAQQVGA